MLGLAGFIVMADNWVVSPILPAIAQDINVDIVRAGLLITAYMLIVGISLLGLGFILTHSTLLTRTTEFAQKSRGAAMSLVAFSFMGGGGVGTAVGGKLITMYSINSLFLIYGTALFMTLILSYLLIRDI